MTSLSGAFDPSQCYELNLKLSENSEKRKKEKSNSSENRCLVVILFFFFHNHIVKKKSIFDPFSDDCFNRSFQMAVGKIEKLGKKYLSLKHAAPNHKNECQDQKKY